MLRLHSECRLDPFCVSHGMLLTCRHVGPLRRLLKQRVLRVDAAQDALYTLLELAVAATPWVTRFGAEAQFGIGKPSDPYVRLCRAECMLALVILHVEQRAVDFLEEERLEVLRDAVTSDAVDAVRAAAASIPDS